MKLACRLARRSPSRRPPPPNPRRGPRPAGHAEDRSSLHAVHAAERTARDPARGSQRPDRHGQHVVPRRLVPRAARPHRIRSSVRAPDVHGVGPRETGRVRHAAGSGRRDQQRLDRNRPHQLLDQRAVECPRAGAVPGIGSHGVSARHDDAGNRRRAAGRREERAAPELRESSVRDGRHHADRDAVSRGSSLPLAGDRLHAGPDRRQLRGRGRVFQAGTTGRGTPAWWSRAISTRRRPAG